MNLLTAACVLTALEPWLWTQGYILVVALAVMVAGIIMTIWRRARAAYLYLESGNHV